MASTPKGRSTSGKALGLQRSLWRSFMVAAFDVGFAYVYQVSALPKANAATGQRV